MSSMNRATLIGNVGKNPEITSLNNGGRVAKFSVATSETWKDKNTGEKKEKTDWHNIVVWNDGLIGVIDQYVHKGSKVCVEGKIQTRKWQDNSGNDRYATEIVLQGFDAKLILLGGKDGGGGNSERSRDDGGGGKAKPTASHDDMDDDIPFD